MTTRPCVITNLPLIEDVARMLELLSSFGAKVERLGTRKVRISCEQLVISEQSKTIIGKFRGSILSYGGLLSRQKIVQLPEPGGCLIGARPIDTHLAAFKQFGVKVSRVGRQVRMERGAPKSEYELVLSEFSVTGTCNALLYAACLPARTRIMIADEDYQVQELLKVLVKMGVKLVKLGHHEIIIRGSAKLKGFSHQVMYDPLEAGTFIVLAAATKSELLVKNVELDYLTLFLKRLRDAGLPLRIDKVKKQIKVGKWQKLRFGRLQSLPFPGLQSDLLSTLAVLATQATGPTLIQDPLYEGRFKCLEELTRMGADIFFADPHRAIITGPTKLFGRKLGPMDLRGGAALIIAGLIAQGRSLVDNIYQVDRGYERIEERLQKVGARIKRINN